MARTAKPPFKQKKYNLIIVDAVDRVNCAINSIKQLSPNGVLILDDSEQEEYSAIFKFFIKKKFKKIDFYGISPGYFNRKATTIFYRPNNCLNI